LFNGIFPIKHCSEQLEGYDSSNKIGGGCLKKANKVLPKVSRKAEPGAQLISVEPDNMLIVGIGASAGGLKAFEAFFSGLPAVIASNVAFVLVQHLSPDHKSMLADLVSRYTSMKVLEVTDGMVIQPDYVYIIPPNHDMAVMNGSLQLMKPVAPHGQRLPIDFFFRSLAQDQRGSAIAIVLSGNGSDGTLGIRAIKGEGGMVMVQSPVTAEFDGMPLNSIATGMVDYELPPSKMGTRLIAYIDHFKVTKTFPFKTQTTKTNHALSKLYMLIRNQTGHDFSQYKPSTITRRIERRLAVHQIKEMSQYVQFLQATPMEVEALFYDLLIGVTKFFRDQTAMEYLEKIIIPKLFNKIPDGEPIRIWSVGCSSGEEAYSIAILVREYIEKMKIDYAVQLFATDIDSRAIVIARNGLYPASIANDISEERLKRFFTLEPNSNMFRINKVIRDMLIFSEQDVIKDPPFSKLDLLVCRNLLIYLNTSLQLKLISVFHYALKPYGILMLGTSEGIGKAEELFEVADRKHKFFRSKIDIPGMKVMYLKNLSSEKIGRLFNKGEQESVNKSALEAKISLREITEKAILNKIAPASLLIQSNGDIVYLHGKSGVFLELIPGEVIVNNVIKMAKKGLQDKMRTALYKAVKTKNIIRSTDLKVNLDGHYHYFTLTVCPVLVDSTLSSDERLYLMTMEEQASIKAPTTSRTNADSEPKLEPNTKHRVKELEEELSTKEKYLQFTQEQLETTNEELKSSNEEMQSINEELQSTNEELETSKEELQSINEELSTVNNELQTKVSDLSLVNNDMNNLLAGTRIATLFVDHSLRILRFTPTAYTILNLIASDVGRPVSHIVSNLTNYDKLIDDIQEVLDTLKSIEIDVEAKDGMWYTMHIQPYRTLDNVIEGAVLSFIDITNVKEVQTKLEHSEGKFRSIFDNVPFGVACHMMIYNSSGQAIDYSFLESNQSYRTLIGFDPRGKTMRELTPVTEPDPFDWMGTFEQVVKTGKKVKFEQRISPSNCLCECIVFRYEPDHFATIFINVTKRKKAEDALQEAEAQLQQHNPAKPNINN
jgi:two-component system CheB/CheR fusion protein